MGPVTAGFVVVAAAATGSAAALLGGSDRARPSAAYPSAAPTPPAPADGRTSGAGATLGSVSASASASAWSSVSASPAPPPVSIAEVADRPRQNASWPVFTYTLRAATGTAEPPDFPGVVEGFRKIRTAHATVTLSRNRYFTAVGTLPVRTATYDVCRQQRFYIRWLAVDPAAVVESTFVDEHVRTVQNRPVHGAAGWMSSYGCVQPALRINPAVSGIPATATAIVETEVWQR